MTDDTPSSAMKERNYMQNNIETVAHHLSQPGARMAVSYDGDIKLVVDPGEVNAEIARRLGSAQRQGLPSAETMLNYASILEKPKFDIRNGIKYPLPNGEATEAAIKALRFCAALAPGHAGAGEATTWRQSDEAIRNMIAREIWRYQECEEAYGPFDDNADESKQLDIGMRSLIKQTAIDQAELIRAVVLASPVVKAAIAGLITDDDFYEIGKRDGYEDAVQDFDLATGGDGEFKGSTIPGETVDVPAMKARVIARFAAPLPATQGDGE